MSYTARLASASLALMVITVLVILTAPRLEAVQVIDQSPVGDEVAVDSIITVTFSRPVDQATAERAFALWPVVKGHFEWQGQTLLFRPGEPMQPGTTYRVTILPGLRDRDGRVNQGPISWPFRTHSP